MLFLFWMYIYWNCTYKLRSFAQSWGKPWTYYETLICCCFYRKKNEDFCAYVAFLVTVGSSYSEYYIYINNQLKNNEILKFFVLFWFIFKEGRIIFLNLYIYSIIHVYDFNRSEYTQEWNFHHLPLFPNYGNII